MSVRRVPTRADPLENIMSVDQPVAMWIPFLLMAGFWIFVIWAVLATIGALKEIRDELSRIREELGRSGRIEP